MEWKLRLKFPIKIASCRSSMYVFLEIYALLMIFVNSRLQHESMWTWFLFFFKWDSNERKAIPNRAISTFLRAKMFNFQYFSILFCFLHIFSICRHEEVFLRRPELYIYDLRCGFVFCLAYLYWFWKYFNVI